MVRLARGIDGVIVDHNDLDVDPFLLNVINGTVDLRTGKLLDHDPEHLITLQAPVMHATRRRSAVACMRAPVAPDPDQCVYLHRKVGSAITGQPVEHVFVNHGDGGKGKSKFFGAIAGVLGPYYLVPHKSSLVVQRHEQHDTVRARLFRARMAVGAETDQAARLDEKHHDGQTGPRAHRARRPPAGRMADNSQTSGRRSPPGRPSYGLSRRTSRRSSPSPGVPVTASSQRPSSRPRPCPRHR